MISCRNNRVILIIPPYNMSRVMSALPELPDAKYGNIQVYPFLGVNYLASVLLSNNYDVTILDCVAQNVSIDNLVDKILHINPVLVGIYVNSFVLRAVKRIIESIKKTVEIPIVVGGPHITADPDIILSLGADFGVRGDGERGILNILNHILQGEKIESDYGVFTRSDVLSSHLPNEFINTNIEDLPFPLRSGYDEYHYFTPFYGLPFTTMIASRGCPYNCIFCMSAGAHTYRIRPIDSVIDELSLLNKMGYYAIQFQDDVFNINRRWLNEFCDKLIKTGLNKRLIWDCNIRVDLMDRDVMNHMYYAGCRMIRFGAETYSEGIRNDILKKNFDNSQIQKVVNDAKRVGIKTLGYFMLGLPEERNLSADEYTKYILQLGLNYIDVSILVILPGTQIERMAINNGIIKDDFWSEYISSNMDLPVYVSNRDELSALRRMQRRILTDFYLRKEYIVSEFVSSIKERRILSSIRAFYKLSQFYLI